MKKTSSNIESLLSIDPNRVSAPALKAALELHQKQVAEQAAQNALAHLQRIDHDIAASVATVRRIRAQEKCALDLLHKLTAAKEQFLKDGDYAAYCNSRVLPGVL